MSLTVVGEVPTRDREVLEVVVTFGPPKKDGSPSLVARVIELKLQLAASKPIFP